MSLWVVDASPLIFLAKLERLPLLRAAADDWPGVSEEAEMETMRTKTLPWDAAEHLETEEDMAAYLEAALEEGDASLVAAALGDIARAKGMTEIARQTGLGRESLYKALSPEGNPELATILKVVRSLGLSLHAKAG